MNDGGLTFSGEDDSTVVESNRRGTVARPDRSQLIEEAVEAFLTTRQTGPGVSVKTIAAQYRRFGSAVESSILRQLEVEQYLAENSWARPEAAAFAWPSVGQQCGPFEILEELGAGSLARVYLCRDMQLEGRQMVLKFGRSSLQEAKTLSRLQHPHIVPVYSILDDTGPSQHVICMPFLGRSTLHDLVALLKETPRPWRASSFEAAGALWIRDGDLIADAAPSDSLRSSDFSDGLLDIALALASALQYAHGKGVLHGDLKPSNVLLTPGGVPMLVDFNLSGDAVHDLAPRGGTLPYMPPEQLRRLTAEGVGGDAVSYDERGDLYSLGACLFEVATGEPPIKPREVGDTSYAALARDLLLRLQAQSGTWRERLRDVDPGVAKLIERCLQFDPARRPQSAEELVRDIRHLMAPRRRAARYVRRHRRLATAACGAVVLASVAGGAYLYQLPPVHVRLTTAGVAARDRGDLEESVALLKQAVGAEPDYARARYELGWALVDSDRLLEARDEFGALKDLKPPAGADAGIGYCFQQLGNHTAAIPCYEAALAAGDTSPAIQNNLAVAYELGRSAYRREEEFARARDLLRAARQTRGDSTVILANLVQVELWFNSQGEAGALTRALEAATQLQNSAPLSRPDYSLIARTFALAAERDPALDDDAVDAILAACRRGAGPNHFILRAAAPYSRLADHPRMATFIQAREPLLAVEEAEAGFTRLLSVEREFPSH